MGVIRGRLRPCGPVIDITLMASPQRVAKLRAASLQYPAPVTIAALIDTGASDCAIDSNVLNGLGLTATGSVPVHTPSSGSEDVFMDEFDASVTLASGDSQSRTFTVSVVGGDFGGREFFALVGWNVLIDCVLTCDGPAGTFKLEF